MKLINTQLLKRWPLPLPDRAGARKFQIATPKCIASAVALSVLEAMVTSLPKQKPRLIQPTTAKARKNSLPNTDAVMVGPGMLGGDNGRRALLRFVTSLVPQLKQATLVLDAEGITAMRDKPDLLKPLRGRVIITPHAGEMASLLKKSKSSIQKKPEQIAIDCARERNVVTVLRGHFTFIADPSGKCFCNKSANIGLATSGSGDTLSGIIGGQAARGADPLRAAVWGVFLHAKAGEQLAKRMGPLGYLARELLAEVPPLMLRLQ